VTKALDGAPERRTRKYKMRRCSRFFDTKKFFEKKD